MIRRRARSACWAPRACTTSAPSTLWPTWRSSLARLSTRFEGVFKRRHFAVKEKDPKRDLDQKRDLDELNGDEDTASEAKELEADSARANAEVARLRSEERRVGKECRGGWAEGCGERT